MSKRYEQEQGENAKKIKALRLELKKDEGKRMDIDEFLETVRRYTDATTITKRMVAELIDHIEVYHAEKQDGVTNQRVVIHYNCIGAFDVPDRRKIPEADIIMETRKGVALSYAPEQVATRIRSISSALFPACSNALRAASDASVTTVSPTDT